MFDLSTLNPPQREAVTTTEGPLLVLAGAGSGKTRVIAHRVAYLLLQDVEPEQILCVTFTNKAAAEMRERVVALAGPPGVEVFVSTFHSFGLWLLGQEHAKAELPKRFAILDAGDQMALVKRCMREVSIDDRKFDAHRVLSILSRAKNDGKKRIAVKSAGQGDDYDLVAAEVFPRYQRALRAMRAVDFDDLIVRPVEIGSDEAVRKKLHARFRYLLVDEYQDTNVAQLDLLRLVVGKEKNVCAVGDDDQAIYGWRGAEVKNILRFEKHFPGAKEVRLEQNYRSTGRILACANAVISKNPARKPKALFTEAGPGDKVQVVALADEEEEASFVAEEIARQRGEGRAWSQFAVLYRLNALSRPFEEAFREAGVPYAVHGGPAFFDRSEVRDLLAYLKLCVQPEDDVSLSRIVNVPARGIGDTSMERVHDYAIAQKLPLLEAMRKAKEIPELPRGADERIAAFVALVEDFRERFRKGEPAEVAKALVAEIDLYSHARASVASLEAGARKVEGIDGLLRSLEGYTKRMAKPSLAAWLHRLALDSREEEDPSGEGGITLMTLHAAKGLEFPVVFLVGVEEDYLPCAGIKGEERDLEEERRLAYVGITRAREKLYLTRVSARTKRGKLVQRTPSRFLAELPEGAFEIVDPTKVSASPQEVAVHSDSLMAGLRARLGSAK